MQVSTKQKLKTVILISLWALTVILIGMAASVVMEVAP